MELTKESVRNNKNNIKTKAHTPVSGLFFREFYPVHKEILYCYIIAMTLSAVFVLVNLSTELGNLSKLSAQTLSVLKTLLPGYATYLPGCLFMLATSSSLTLAFDFTPKWRCYQSSIPISEWKLIGVKFLTSILILTAGIITSTLNAIIMCIVFKMDFNTIILANIFLCAGIVTLFVVVLYIFAYIFRNINTALILLCIFLFIGYIIFMFNNINNLERLASKTANETLQITLDRITDFSIRLFPYTIPCIIGMFVLGWIFCSLLAKRREK